MSKYSRIVQEAKNYDPNKGIQQSLQSLQQGANIIATTAKINKLKQDPYNKMGQRAVDREISAKRGTNIREETRTFNTQKEDIGFLLASFDTPDLTPERAEEGVKVLNALNFVGSESDKSNLDIFRKSAIRSLESMGDYKGRADKASQEIQSVLDQFKIEREKTDANGEFIFNEGMEEYRDGRFKELNQSVMDGIDAKYWLQNNKFNQQIKDAEDFLRVTKLLEQVDAIDETDPNVQALAEEKYGITDFERNRFQVPEEFEQWNLEKPFQHSPGDPNSMVANTVADAYLEAIRQIQAGNVDAAEAYYNKAQTHRQANISKVISADKTTKRQQLLLGRKNDVNLAKQHSKQVKGMVGAINNMIQVGNDLAGIPKTQLPDVGMVDYTQLEEDLSMKLLDELTSVSAKFGDDVAWAIWGGGTDFVQLARAWQKESGNAKDAVEIVKELRKGTAGKDGKNLFIFKGEEYDLTQGGADGFWKNAMDLDYSGISIRGKSDKELLHGRFTQRIMEALDNIHGRDPKIDLVREWAIANPEDALLLNNMTDEQQQQLQFLQSLQSQP